MSAGDKECLQNLKINFHSKKNADNDIIKQIEKLEIALNHFNK